MRSVLGIAIVAAMAGVVIVVGTRGAWAQPAPSAAATSIGVDAAPQGNSATLLGAVDDCVSVAKGDKFQVDVFVQDVSELLAWEAYLSFDGNSVQVTDRDVEQFLAAPPNASLFDVSESTPDSDGHYPVCAANIGGGSEGASGAGVLARVTLEPLQ